MSKPVKKPCFIELLFVLTDQKIKEVLLNRRANLKYCSSYLKPWQPPVAGSYVTLIALACKKQLLNNSVKFSK